MYYPILFYLLATTLLSYFACIALLPYVYKYGLKLGIIDGFDERKVEAKYQVRFGGLAIVIPFYLSIFITYIFSKVNFLEISFNFSPLIIIALFSGIFFFIIGLLDDLFSLSPYLRLILQITVISITISLGFYIKLEILDDLFLKNTFFLNSFYSIITILFLVGLINSFNWIDGLDGLASGVTGIVTFGFLLMSIISKNNTAAILAASNIGAVLGFLKYNSYPSKMIMGDGGSYFLGYISGVIGLFSLSSNIQNFDIVLNWQNLILLFLILFLPIFDMTLVIFRRLKNGKSPFFPDRTHLHHVFYDRGLSHKKTVFLIYVITQWFVSLAVSIRLANNNLIILISSLALLISVLLIQKDHK